MLVKFFRFLGYQTHDELTADMEQGYRKSIRRGDVKRANLLERAMLPRGTRYPMSGDVYEAIHDVQVSYLTHWRAPFTGAGEATLPKGERIVVDELIERKPLSVCCQARRKDEIEELFVPRNEREGEKYDGYSISVKTESLNRDFRLIDRELQR